MNVILKSFCEDVPLTDPKNVKRYLVFDLNGNEFRVPVGAEAIQAIARHIYGKPALEVESEEPPKQEAEEEKYEAEESPEEETEATVFGGEDEESDDELPPDDEDDPIGALELQRVQIEEDGVPPL